MLVMRACPGALFLRFGVFAEPKNEWGNCCNQIQHNLRITERCAFISARMQREEKEPNHAEQAREVRPSCRLG